MATTASVDTSMPTPGSVSERQCPPTKPSDSLYSGGMSEASLVRLALNAMQGLESALICIQKLSALFCCDPADRSYNRIPTLWNRISSTYALGNVLNSIGCFGSLVYLLHKFVDNFMYIAKDHQCHSDSQKEEGLSYSLVNQAFAVAVGKVLEGYISSLNTVYASARLRKSSKVDADETCLTSIVHCKITLLEVYLHMKELRSRIEALGNICNLYSIALCFSSSSLDELAAKAVLEFSNFYRGGDLLTYLYTQLQVADPAHSALLKFLFLHSCEPYCQFIRSWIFRAETSDPYKEFIVESGDNLPPDLHSKVGTPIDFPLASIRDGVAVPCFLKNFLVPIIRSGQQLQVLMKLLELCSYTGPADNTNEGFLPNFSGYMGDHLFHASAITFSKQHLQAMMTIRNNYYENMLEKLGHLLTKLEFRYQQVVTDDIVPTYFDNNGEGLKSDVLCTLDERSNVSSTFDRWNLHLAMDREGSSTGDECYGLDACESSECSSLSSFEEQTETEQRTENPNYLVGHEQKYFSSLRFYSSSRINNTLQKPTQYEGLHDRESNISEKYTENYALDCSVQPYSKKFSPTHMLVPIGLRESNLSYIDRLTYKNWSHGILNTPCCVDEGSKYYQGLLEYDAATQVNEAGPKSINEGVPCFQNTISAKDCSAEALCQELEIGVRNASSFTLHQRKDNCSSTFLCSHPMLRKNLFLNPMMKPGQKSSSSYGQSLPCFDFSTVEDPCKVYVEKLALNSRHKLINNGETSYTSDKIHGRSKQGSDGDSMLDDNDRAACPSRPLLSKDQGQESLVSADVYGGKSWESLLYKFNFAENGITEEQKESLSAIFEIPLDFIIDKCILQEILFQYKYVSKLAIKILEGFDLHEHFLALRRYYLMELADWADLFIMSLWHHKWGASEADQRVSEIQGFLELSVQRSSCERDPNKNRLYVYIKENTRLPLATSAVGIHFFDFLGLGYRVDWPVSIVLTPSALRIYSNIFSFLIQVKLAVFALTDSWRSLKDLKQFVKKKSRSTAYVKELSLLNLLIKMRQQVDHFISSLQQYLQSQLSHVSWCIFLHNLKYKVKDMMDLESVHMEYLMDSLHICFLSDETRPVANIIESILQCALDFRASLTSCMWDVGLVEGGLLGILSRINISQVLDIKQKFDQNMKELKLCYLKSPKHGKFGLSCFWSHLNYNDYYTDNDVYLYPL